MMDRVGPYRRQFPEAYRTHWFRELIEDGALSLALLPASMLELLSRRQLGTKVLRRHRVLIAVALPFLVGIWATSLALLVLSVLAWLRASSLRQATTQRIQSAGGVDVIGEHYEGDPFYGWLASRKWRWPATLVEAGLWAIFALMVMTLSVAAGVWLLVGSACLVGKLFLVEQHRIHRARIREAQQYADHAQLSPHEALQFDRPEGFERGELPSPVAEVPEPETRALSSFNRTREALPEGLRALVAQRRLPGKA